MPRQPYGEYRVNFRGGSEASAAYDSDLESAVLTGYAMAGVGGVA